MTSLDSPFWRANLENITGILSRPSGGDFVLVFWFLGHNLQDCRSFKSRTLQRVIIQVSENVWTLSICMSFLGLNTVTVPILVSAHQRLGNNRHLKTMMYPLQATIVVLDGGCIPPL